MSVKRPWLVATATIALAGFGTTAALATGGPAPNDTHQTGVIELADDSPEPDDSPDLSATDSTGSAPDPSPESADSPAASATDSAASGSDSPDDPDWDTPSPDSADSPPPAAPKAAATPAAKPAPKVVDSADSPAPRRPAPRVDSADSPWYGSADSGGGSVASADS